MKHFLSSWWIRPDFFFPPAKRKELEFTWFLIKEDRSSVSQSSLRQNCKSCMWEMTSQGLPAPENFTGKNAQVCSALSHTYQMPVASQHSVRCLCLGCVSCQTSPSDRLWKLKLCPTVGPGASLLWPGLPTATFPQGIWRHTITNLVVTLTVPVLLHAAGLWGGGCSGGSWVTFMFWLTLSYFYCEEKCACVLFFFFFTSFQTHTHNFCLPGCTLSPSLHVFAMSQKLIISSATACNLCTGGKQEATGKPKDLHEAWNKPLQTAYTTHRSDLKLTSREKNALKSVIGKTPYPESRSFVANLWSNSYNKQFSLL